MSGFWRPIICLCLFLLVDKLLFIPELRSRLTLAPNLSFDLFDQVDSIVNQQTDQNSKQKLNQNQPNESVWIFGTSRSIAFKSIDKRPYVFALPASVPTVYLHQYLYLRKFSSRPDIVFIEVSQFALNRNYSLRSAFLYETAPNLFILRNLQSYPISYLSEWFMSLVVVSSVYPIGFYSEQEKTLVEFLNPLNQKSENDQFNNNQSKSARSKNIQSKDIQSRDIQSNLKSNNKSNSLTNVNESKYRTNQELLKAQSDIEYKKFFRSIYVDGQLKNYTIDTVAIDSLNRLIEQLKKDKVNVVLFTPPVHQSITKLYQELEINKPFYKAVENISIRNRVPYIPINENSLSCQLYKDEAHFADVCYHEIFDQIVEQANRVEKLNRMNFNSIE